MRFTILTLGCKTNQVESEALFSELLQRGYQPVGLQNAPDICIINTCTVTSKSDYQSRQLIRRALKSGAKVIVTGCYVNASIETLKAEFSERCLFFKNEEKISILNQLNIKNSSNNLIFSPAYSRTRPAVKIQDGCNKRCSYCIIPSVRGRSRSKSPDDVINEIKAIEEAGYNEVVLTGINLGSYGRDLNPSLRLHDLIERILLQTESIRIRISSLGINEVTDKLIEMIGTNSRLCRHLHLSLQSGDNRILRLMNRNYRSEDFIALVEKLKKSIKDINIGVDIIIGFPGESETEFNNTLMILKNTSICYIHVFPFSKRPGTPASKMPFQIDSKTKEQRLKAIKDLDKELRRTFALSQVGTAKEVIIEELDNGFAKGKTDNYLNVYTKTLENLKKGELLKIIISKYTEKGLLGEPLINS